jgi:flagellar M-ring protein FliF
MLPEDQVSLGGASRGPGGYDDKLNAARQAAAQDPKRVAQVVKGWVAADAG